MNNNKVESSVKTKTAKSQPQADRILISIDTHAGYHVVGRQIDASSPQALQRMTPDALVPFIQRQQKQAREVHVVYEAGPCGFMLARDIQALGARCWVAVPRKLDPHNKRVCTDKTDTRELLWNLDRYLRGNKRAMRVVRIPTLEEELRRARNRQRDALCRDLRRLASRGRMLLLEFGHRVSNHWWRPRQWEQRVSTLASALVEMLEQYRSALLALQKLIAPLERKITADAPLALPAGMGKLTFVLLLHEALNWERFKTRRQVGGFTGLCGGVQQSGNSRQELSITKSGHKRMRTLLVEMAWRLLRFQPDSALVKKWAPRMEACGKNKSRRKQIIVAMARQLAVDMWKWQTGRISPEQLGWTMVKPS